MAMTILNNTAAQMTLGELNKNITRVGKDLKKIAKGERLPNFGADASDVAISEKMRVQIRVLGQDIKNTQNGRSLINIASGGAENIIEELRTLKELALNSCNDHNTDVDRKILQKEFDAIKAHIDSIANETNYNGIPLLDGRWKRIIPGGGFETKERLLSQTSEKIVDTKHGTMYTTGPTTNVITPTPVVKETSSVSQYIATMPVSPSHTESVPIVTTSVISTPFEEEPKTTVVSRNKVSKDPIITVDNDIRTVVNDDTYTTKKLISTTNGQRSTTTTTSTKTITDVAVKDLSTTTVGEPTIITNGTTSITSDGVYEFAPDYTGTLTISASNVQLNGPKNGAALKDVYIMDSGVKDLYIKNLNIQNRVDGSYEGPLSCISFGSDSDNTLHVLGNNVINDLGATATSISTGRNIICVGGGLSIVGNGSLSVTTSVGVNQAATIGGLRNNSCGDINIGQEVKLTINANKLVGAAIGSSSCGSCGNITIGKNATINIYQQTTGSSVKDGATIGAGNGGQCGNIIVYSGAEINTVSGNGAGIGLGNVTGYDPNNLDDTDPAEAQSSCGDITIYSDVKLNISTKEAACIGIGKYNGSSSYIHNNYMGNITVYSYPNSNISLSPQSSEAEKVGHGAKYIFEPASVNLLSEYNHTEGGVLDLSEMPLPTTTNPKYEVTTTTTEEVTTSQIINETRTTTNEPVDETENVVTTSIFQTYEEEIPDRLGDPLIIHTGTKANQNLPIYIEDMRLQAIGVKDTKIETLDSAKNSLDIIDSAIDYALDQATSLGAYSIGLSYTESNLTLAEEMTIASESSVRDADMAKEMASFAKNNVLAQASQSMLAQANQNSSSVLSLLQ